MKTNRLLLFILPLLSLTGCTDNCKETRTFRRYSPVSFTATQLRLGVQTEAPQPLVNPGKIYTKDQFLFINELKQGIHIIDNRNPSAPKPVAFIRIPGNGDIAIRNNILYADSYMDLIAFDISNPSSVQAINRVQDVFPNGSFEGGWWSYDAPNQMLYDQKVSYVTETVDTNCDEGVNPAGGWTGGIFSSAFFNSASSDNSGSSTTNGVAGSMARFALYDDYLYTVNQSAMQLFNIKNPAEPKVGNKIQMSWGIETIFPYKDKLFIGSQTGMHIYDNANPEKPVLLSVFQHARVCDPVVVHDNIAYVTLRSGNQCGGFTNQLDVVDITDLVNPRLLKSYPMRNPHGLGISYPNLFICEGAYGLKSFDIRDVMNVDRNLLQHIENLNAFDVIPLEKSLLLIGKDGFYQFDASNPRQLRQLSHIPVSRPTYY
ncbi:LVIVD repeat-containing protein [Spirosoma flavum]|uniref:LVIVD repeat-containing protein n=1 Tax=Spirosoma flavum TaxID=2048557 RepID=A0ABW6ADL0_9BACT